MLFPLHDDNPTYITPILTVCFIVICCVVYFWQFNLGPEMGQAAVYSYGMIPAVLFDQAELPATLERLPAELTVISSMFMHGGWMHLIGNMLYLWIFGNNVEDSMGHVKFIVFYLICGIVAALSQALLEPGSEIPMIGASGAVSGVLGAYLLLYPHARVLVVLPIFVIIKTFRIPAMYVLGFWFLTQIVSSMMTNAGEPGVAWWAHIGGFIAGMVLIPFFKDDKHPLFQAGNRF